jgi:AcrR family transcriptional regulator
VGTASTFGNLDPSKQAIIRNACLREFARAGYSGASTNVMCSEAGIAKGLLFYYFGSKKGLFLYLTEHCTQVLNDSFLHGLELKRETIFDRIVTLTLRKWALTDQHPLEYGFLAQQLCDCPPDVEQKIAAMKKVNVERYLQILVQNIDFSDLRPDLDPAKAIDIVLFVVEGFRARNIEKYRSNPRPLSELHYEIIIELRKYLDLCRTGLCR